MLHVRVSAADNGEMSSGVIKSKAVSCPLVTKNWSAGDHDGPTESPILG